jgi:hypothetical protein
VHEELASLLYHFPVQSLCVPVGKRSPSSALRLGVVALSPCRLLLVEVGEPAEGGLLAVEVGRELRVVGITLRGKSLWASMNKII